ncbi:26S proteasome non-ATPase regulatory subunit 5 [Drosophila innubila]|uniref:26S proteasome non-ATPase regulatory subunit 5 n=1 Tax=Drosophila innubila TaxID=198719 RepID=UPI00148C970D|nr:26S proteasome non-ATPase regulatory subunit 5 [Drosophila innubila]
MDEEWWQCNLRELETVNKREETLSNMYANINKQSALPINRQVIELLLRAPNLYECARIVKGEKEQEQEQVVNLAIDVLRSCLQQLELDIQDAKLPELLSLPLTHSNPAVRSLVLGNLLKQLRSQREPKPLPSTELLLYVLDELQQPETQSSVIAIDILNLELTNWLTDSGVQSKLLQLLQRDEMVCCRVYELAVMLAKHSAASLSSVEFILDAALSELDNDDVLLMSSVMEILVPLAEQNHGLSYMERRRVLDIISSRVERIDENPLDALILPSIMKFFGKIAAVQPQKIIAGYPQMLACLFQLLESGDEAMLPTGLDTLANLTSTVQGKLLMHQHFQSAMEQLLRKYSTHLKNLSPPLKIRLLNSLDVIYTLEGMPSSELNTILLGWYECFAGGRQVNHIMELLHTPFPDLQLAALGLLKTLCQYPWGITAVQQTAGAIEFLLSRQQDLDKDVKYLKWQIMQLLSVSSEFTPTEIVRFTAYVNEGPLYQQTVVNIATEGQGSQ